MQQDDEVISRVLVMPRLAARAKPSAARERLVKEILIERVKIFCKGPLFVRTDIAEIRSMVRDLQGLEYVEPTTADMPIEFDWARRVNLTSLSPRCRSQVLTSALEFGGLNEQTCTALLGQEVWLEFSQFIAGPGVVDLPSIGESASSIKPAVLPVDHEAETLSRHIILDKILHVFEDRCVWPHVIKKVTESLNDLRLAAGMPGHLEANAVTQYAALEALYMTDRKDMNERTRAGYPTVVLSAMGLNADVADKLLGDGAWLQIVERVGKFENDSPVQSPIMQAECHQPTTLGTLGGDAPQATLWDRLRRLVA